MSDKRLKAAPYSRHPDIAHGELVMIYCGSRAWKLCEPGVDRAPAVVYPKNVDPAEYSWPVRDLDVLVMARDEEGMKVKLLVIELINQGASRVIVAGLAAGLADEDGIVSRTIYERPS